MLATASSPSINFTPRSSLSSGQPHLCRRHGCFFLAASNGCSSSRSGVVLVRAGYTRKPLETAGAYQVVDEETGEKFIVWGGADDPPDSPLPPKDVLFWKPPKPPINADDDEGNEHVAAAEIPTVKGFMGFKKLKVHKLRASVNKTSPRKQEMIDHSDEPVAKDDQSTYSNGKIKFMDTKKKVNSHGHEGNVLRDRISPQFKDTATKKKVDSPDREGNVSRDSKSPQIKGMATKKKVDSPERGGNVSRESKSPQVKDRIQEFKDKTKGTRAEGGVNDPELVVQRNTEPFSENKKNGDGPHKSNAKTNARDSTSRSARLGGWGGGEGGSEPESKYRTTDQQKSGRKSSFDSDFFSRKSFRDIGCSEYMIECLKAQSFLRPSHIQAMVFSSIFEGKSCIVADQSGSGKTMAYLAPVIQRLRDEELQGVSKSLPLSPRVVILVPTAELASQVLSNCRSISKFGVPFRSMAVTGGFRQKTQLETLQQGVDVVVATPGRFMYLIKEGHLQFTNIRCAVLDEVDILFNDEDFEASLQNLINSSPVTTQYLFATATLPVRIYNKLVEVFPDCNVVMGPGMHRTSPRLEEVLVDCSGDYGAEKSPETAFTNKKAALLQIVEKRRVSKTIVFCNKIETCRQVENALKRFDRKEARVKVLPFHSALDQGLRLTNMKEFISPRSKDDSLFLVCTDRASRGIDFPDVDHVILFDFPRDPSEYVRRVGRTARGASGKGKAFALVVGKQVSLAGRVMERNHKGRPLHDVPAAYELFA